MPLMMHFRVQRAAHSFWYSHTVTLHLALARLREDKGVRWGGCVIGDAIVYILVDDRW